MARPAPTGDDVLPLFWGGVHDGDSCGLPPDGMGSKWQEVWYEVCMKVEQRSECSSRMSGMLQQTRTLSRPATVESKTLRDRVTKFRRELEDCTNQRKYEAELHDAQMQQLEALYASERLVCAAEMGALKTIALVMRGEVEQVRALDEHEIYCMARMEQQELHFRSFSENHNAEVRSLNHSIHSMHGYLMPKNFPGHQP